MKKSNHALDQYTRRARLYPALLTALPLPITLAAILPKLGASLVPLWTVAVWCGATFLLAQLGRDRGKRKEKALFDSWGGPPTTVLLRHRGADNPKALEQVHRWIQGFLPDLELPAEATEADDEERADKSYEVAVLALREATRDQSVFPLVFEENCNYGFRRNLWGLKPIALMVNFSSLIVLGAALITGLVQTGEAAPLLWVALATLVLLFTLWTTVVNTAWVREVAFSYAERLLSAGLKLSEAAKLESESKKE